MTRNCHNHTLQTNPQHRYMREETHKTNSHIPIRRQVKKKTSALSSSFVYGKPLHDVFLTTLFVKVKKKDLQTKKTYFEKYNLTFLDMYNELSEVIAPNLKEESNGLQRVMADFKKVTYR